MGLRQATDLVLKPLCAVGFVGVVVSALRRTPSGLFESRGFLENALRDLLLAIPYGERVVFFTIGSGPTLWHTFLATLFLSICLLDNRGRNVAANHGGIGLLVGLLNGLISFFVLFGPFHGGPVLTLVFALLVALPVAIVGAIIGFVIGIARRSIAASLARPASPSDGKPEEQKCSEIHSGLLARPRIIKFTVFGIGLMVVFVFCMIDRLPQRLMPRVDTRGLEEIVRLGSAGGAGLPKPVRSVGIWQPRGTNALAFSSDGKFLATGGGGVVDIWRTADWTSAGELHQTGLVSTLAFSPDGRFLYVAANDDPDPILCRFEWRTGRRDKVFEGHKKQVDGMALSTDGQTMITASSLEDLLYLWNTTTGAIVGSFDCSSPRFAYAPQRDLVVQWSTSETGSVTAYLAGAEIPGFAFATDVIAAAFTPDEQSLLVVRRLGSAALVQELSLGVHRVDDLHRIAGNALFSRVWHERADNRWRVLAEEHSLPVGGDEAALAISPDGQQVAVASGAVRLAIYAMPDLKPIKEFHFACRQPQSECIRQVVYSPDGTWLAMGQQGRTTPRLFDVAATEERTVDEGHGDRVLDLRFSADGRSLRSVGKDGTVCMWDTTSMNMLRRISLPTDRLVASIRPSDGRYALCPVPDDPKRPIQVVDLDTGKACCELTLPLTWHGFDAPPRGLARLSRVYWLNKEEVLCTGYFHHEGIGSRDHWWRFDCQTGEIVDEGRRDMSERYAFGHGRGFVTEDGGHLFLLHGGWKGSLPAEIARVNLRTFQSSELGRIARRPRGEFGLVPGGKYFRLGLHIYDRRNLGLVAAKEFPYDKVGIGSVAFSLDGERYAIALRSKTEYVVVIYETLTNRVLLAFRPTTPVVRLQFSQNGSRLALAYADGTLEVRSVPAG